VRHNSTTPACRTRLTSDPWPRMSPHHDFPVGEEIRGVATGTMSIRAEEDGLAPFGGGRQSPVHQVWLVMVQRLKQASTAFGTSSGCAKKRCAACRRERPLPRSLTPMLIEGAVWWERTSDLYSWDCQYHRSASPVEAVHAGVVRMATGQLCQVWRHNLASLKKASPAFPRWWDELDATGLNRVAP